MSTSFAILAPQLFDGDTWHSNTALIVADGRIVEVIPADDVAKTMPMEHLAEGFIAPGFIDLQVNGGGGSLLNNDPSVSGIATICEAHTRLGTTSLFPTLVTDKPATQASAISAAITAWEKNIPGFAGLHLEGPHLSREKKGAHDPDLIRPMDKGDIDVLVAARKKLPVLLVTLAPESVTASQVKTLVNAGVRISIGHSNAGIDAVNALFSTGASLVTHLFNAMSQTTGRQPGLVGAALDSGDVFVGLIADGHHVHASNIALALRAKRGPGKIFLVSDAMSFAGTDAHELVLSGRKVLRRDGQLTLADGTLAGADLDLAMAAKYMRKTVGLDLGEVLRMASKYPAQAVGLANLGNLHPKSAADFVWLDSELSLKSTWIAGQKIT